MWELESQQRGNLKVKRAGSRKLYVREFESGPGAATKTDQKIWHGHTDVRTALTSL